ncbi:hypothetical protein ABB02_00288 [Clostridiaceae bacterium JG1575]|nr:hypothetical protein ABB02_00288 [Clostridiaceae bacterium JG1575]
MDQDHRALITHLIKTTSIIALPLAGLVSIGRDIPQGLSLLLGTFVAVGGFIVSMHTAARHLKTGKSSFFPLLVSFGKVLLSAGLGAVLFLMRREFVIFYLMGFPILFAGLILYTRTLQQKGE